jgi:hypothetical protein
MESACHTLESKCPQDYAGYMGIVSKHLFIEEIGLTI